MIKHKTKTSPKSLTPWENNMEIAKLKSKELAPQYRFDPKSGENVYEWQERARKKYCEILGHDQKVKCDLDLAVEYYEERRDYHKHYEGTVHSPYTEYVEWRFTYQSEDGYRVPAHLVIPRDENGNLPTKKLPIAIAAQGHAKGMHKSLGRQKYPSDPLTPDYDYAIRAMKEGYAVITVEQRCFGECGNNKMTGGTQCTLAAMTSLMMDKSLVGDRIWDAMRAIDVLEEYFSDIVDLDNVMCFGNSGGGATTRMIAAIDVRVKHAFPSCGIVDALEIASVHWACPCGHREMKRIIPLFQNGDELGMIAPRTLMITHGELDDVVPFPGAVEQAQIAKMYYEAAGVPEKVDFIVGPGGHRMYADLGWEAIRPHVVWGDKPSDFTKVVKLIPSDVSNPPNKNLLSNPDFRSGTTGIYGNMDGWVTYDPNAEFMIHHADGQPETHVVKDAGLLLNKGLAACERIVYQKITGCPAGVYSAFGHFKLHGENKPTRLDFKVYVSGHEKGCVDVSTKADNTGWIKLEIKDITVSENQTIRLQIEGDFAVNSGAWCNDFCLSLSSNEERKSYKSPVVKPLVMPHAVYLDDMRSSVPLLRYDGKQLFDDWQNTSREKLAELLGIDEHVKCADDLIVEKITKYPTHTKYKFTVQTEPGYRVPCYFSIPKNLDVKPPVAITLQAHEVGISPEDGFPRHTVEDGFAVLAIEQRCFGESDAYCDTTSTTNIILNRTTYGNRVWDVMRVIDALHKHFCDMVDVDRIACLGISTGGYTALYAACLDKRILNIGTYSAFCNIEDSIAVNYQCLCNYVPSIRKFFEISDLAGLVAPRRFIVTSDNGVYPKDHVEKTYEEAQKLYKAAGAPGNIILAFNHGI